ncbi:unnamed protein product, partial [marine sediment metagenome]
ALGGNGAQIGENEAVTFLDLADADVDVSRKHWPG